jgi:hypothetical protein
MRQRFSNSKVPNFAICCATCNGAYSQSRYPKEMSNKKRIAKDYFRCLQYLLLIILVDFCMHIIRMMSC